MTKREIIKDWLEKKLAEDPELYSTVVGWKQALIDGTIPAEDAAVFMQYHWRKIELVDAFLYAKFNDWVLDNKVVRAKIRVGETPVGDAETDENNRRLEKISKPFSARFWGGYADYDGEVSWEETIVLKGGGEYVAVPPGWAPLEVGYTDAATSYSHLFYTGFLARWAYDDKCVYLMHTPERLLDRVAAMIHNV